MAAKMTLASTPRMTCSEDGEPPATPSPQRFAAPAAGRSNSAQQAPPSAALRKMLHSETAAETAHVRRGEEAAVARINSLKGTISNHERTIALLNANLAAQHELLTDVNKKVATLMQALPSAQGPANMEAIVKTVHQLQHRLQQGASGRPRSSSSGVVHVS